MSYYLNILIAGSIGGVIRGLVGFIKHQYAYKNVKFSWRYFLGMASISGLIGLFSVYVARNLRMSFFNLGYIPLGTAIIIGYAGGDFLENIYKMIIKKPSFYSFYKGK